MATRFARHLVSKKKAIHEWAGVYAENIQTGILCAVILRRCIIRLEDSVADLSGQVNRVVRGRAASGPIRLMASSMRSEYRAACRRSDPHMSAEV